MAHRIAKLSPLFDRVLIEKASAPKKSIGGIILPESAQTKQNFGKVIEVGPGKYQDGKLIPLTVKKGQNVLLSEWIGSSFKVGEKDLLLVREDEILGTVELEETK